MEHLQTEYEAAFKRHQQTLNELNADGQDTDEIINLAADCAARLELISMLLPETLLAALAEAAHAEQNEEAEREHKGDSEDDGEQAAKPST
jgi:hypothetical protein